MYQPYLDILERLGVPLWWDENGVPRYEPFSRRNCADIYNDFAALLEIRCQGCERLFKVAATWSITTGIVRGFQDVVWNKEGNRATPKDGFPRAGDCGAFSFGDAPWHGHNDPIKGQCSGTTMTTTVVRVLEFWEDDKRLPEYEVEVETSDLPPATSCAATADETDGARKE